MPIARATPETIVGETPHLFALVTWVRLVPVSSRSIEVLVSGGSLRGMDHPYPVGVANAKHIDARVGHGLVTVVMVRLNLTISELML